MEKQIFTKNVFNINGFRENSINSTNFALVFYNNYAMNNFYKLRL